MDSTQFLSIMISFGALFFSMFTMFMWNRTESNADRRETRALIDAIHLEIKDFHARLCVIESRNREHK